MLWRMYVVVVSGIKITSSPKLSLRTVTLMLIYILYRSSPTFQFFSSLFATGDWQLRCNNLSTFCFDLLDRLFFLVVDHALFFEVLDLCALAIQLCSDVSNDKNVPSCVRSSSRIPDLRAHMLSLLLPFRSCHLCYPGCCCGRDIRRKHLELRSTLRASSWSGPRMRHQRSSWDPNRRMRTSPSLLGTIGSGGVRVCACAAECC